MSNVLVKFHCYRHDNYLLGEGGCVFGSIGLFVCLSICKQVTQKSYKRIAMKFYGGVWGGAMKNRLNYGADLGLLR